MAIETLAWRHGMRSRQHETCCRVIECCSSPGCCVVALLTGLRESTLNVIRIRSALVVLQMAGHAGCCRQVVVVVDVTIEALTWRNGVRSRQRETCRRVIESRSCP